MSDTCTPEHCSQSDVPMIFRPHTPRTCPATTTAALGHDGSEFCGETTCPECGCCADHFSEPCVCRHCGCVEWIVTPTD